LESVVEIHYVKRDSAPEPGESIVHEDWVSAVRANSNLILTGSYDGIARLWDTDGELLTDTRTLPGHSGQPIKCVAWLSTNEGHSRFVTGSHDETLLVWEWKQKKNQLTCAFVCRGHSRSVDCIAVSPNKLQFCSGSWDSMLKMWSSERQAENEVDDIVDQDEQRPNKRKKVNASKVPTQVPLMTLSGHSEGISSVEWIADTTICTASWDHSIRLWDLQAAAATSIIAGSKAFFSISYSPFNKQIVSGSADRHIRLYDTRSTNGSEVKCSFSSHTGWVSSVDWSPVNEYQFISASYDQLLKLWDTRCPRAPLYDMSGHEDKILACDWSTPRYMLSGGADNCLKVFKTNSSNLLGCELLN
jgi:ribosome biogenesis protein YTM1